MTKAPKKTTTSRSKTTKAPSTRASTPRKTTTKAAAATSSVKATSAPVVTLGVVAPEPVVVSETKAVQAATVVKKKEFLERVATKSGLRKNQVKQAMEATLAALGDALAAGEELNLSGLGKVKVNRTKQVSGGAVIICKVRTSDNDQKSDDGDTDSDDMETGGA